jgi:hypothetical protein
MAKRPSLKRQHAQYTIRKKANQLRKSPKYSVVRRSRSPRGGRAGGPFKKGAKDPAYTLASKGFHYQQKLNSKRKKGSKAKSYKFHCGPKGMMGQRNRKTKRCRWPGPELCKKTFDKNGKRMVFDGRCRQRKTRRRRS